MYGKQFFDITLLRATNVNKYVLNTYVHIFVQPNFKYAWDGHFSCLE